MYVFLDVEFTSHERPEVLSVAMVTELGYECYAELDLEGEVGRLHAASSAAFVRERVIPQLGRYPNSGFGTVAALEYHVAVWLQRLVAHVGQDAELVYSDKVDADLLEEMLQRTKWWQYLQARLRWSIVSYLNAEPVVEVAMTKSWADSRTLDGIKRHHALADARALRAAFHAVHGASDEAIAFEANIADAAARTREQWLADNAEAIHGYNAWVEENGLPLEKYRLF